MFVFLADTIFSEPLSEKFAFCFKLFIIVKPSSFKKRCTSELIKPPSAARAPVLVVAVCMPTIFEAALVVLLRMFF